jgi:hypothetical protein
MNLKKNMSSVYRIVRLVLVALVAILYFMNVISGTLALVLGIVAVIFLVTSLVSFCPLYALFGFSTLKKS